VGPGAIKIRATYECMFATLSSFIRSLVFQNTKFVLWSSVVGLPMQACLALARSRLTFLETWIYDPESSLTSLIPSTSRMEPLSCPITMASLLLSGGKLENGSTRTMTRSKNISILNLTFACCSFSFLDSILGYNVNPMEVDKRHQS
jgi:hypothetical protein